MPELADLINAGIARMDDADIQSYRRRWGCTDAQIAVAGWEQYAHMLHCLQYSESRRKGGFNSEARQSLIEASNTAQGYANLIQITFDL